MSDRQNNVSSVNYDYLSTINFNFDSYDIYNIDSENDISRLTNTDYNEIYPHYSPSGEYIAFISDESGINNIYITDDRFSSKSNITNVLTGITEIDWFSDTEMIFTGFNKMGYDIFQISNVLELMDKSTKIKDSNWKSFEEYSLLRDSNNQIKEYKNLNLLIDSFINVKIKYRDLKLLICGNGSEYISIKKKIDDLGFITDCNWFTTLSRLRLYRFIRELDDIWRYRAQLPQSQKIKISQ